jgi:hypothetical protein
LPDHYLDPAPEPEEFMFPSKKFPTEADLVQGCLAHREDAWQVLYQHYQGRLARSVLRLLGSGKRNLGLAEEIAHDTLSSLCEQDCHRLRVFNSRLCCLHLYLRVLALQRVQLRYRQTHRPGYHEIPLGAYEPPDTGVTIEFLEAQLQALKAMLTPQEQRYFRQELLGEPAPAEPFAFSAPNAEKLRQRVRRKLRGLL